MWKIIPQHVDFKGSENGLLCNDSNVFHATL